MVPESSPIVAAKVSSPTGPPEKFEMMVSRIFRSFRSNPIESTSKRSSAAAATDGSSIVVQSGEGAGSIAARAGISVDELERLNPDHMTSGYWYANPGDVVNVQ